MGMLAGSENPGELVRVADAIRRYLVWIETGEAEGDLEGADLEAAFVRHAAAYSRRKELTYRDWREAGVPVNVLTRAGILEFND